MEIIRKLSIAKAINDTFASSKNKKEKNEYNDGYKQTNYIND